ncbi:hypothetical protein Pcinc_041000 [Petrolisthes cinctipes]|uniref:Uncharacterized protein n=1 Tax=Petrolisthes cinctipes TaxID=88211 RepID=A0AAE1EK90_PETCI|nr:hypothetical protein Pcinc_041000 [Petrolisthes cinctipes]
MHHSHHQNNTINTQHYQPASLKCSTVTIKTTPLPPPLTTTNQPLSPSKQHHHQHQDHQRCQSLHVQRHHYFYFSPTLSRLYNHHSHYPHQPPSNHHINKHCQPKPPTLSQPDHYFHYWY